MKPLIIFLAGPTACGKGYFSKFIKYFLQTSLKYHEDDIAYIGTGDLLRDEITKDTALGQQLKKHFGTGKLSPDHLVLELFFKALELNMDKQIIIIEGVPRTMNQYEKFQHNSIFNDAIFIHLYAELDIRKYRMLRRATIENRVDDTEDIFYNREIEYNQTTLPVINAAKENPKYRFFKIITTIPNEGDIEISKLLEVLIHKKP